MKMTINLFLNGASPSDSFNNCSDGKVCEIIDNPFSFSGRMVPIDCSYKCQ